MRTVAVRRCRILFARVNAYAGDRREVAPRGSRAPHRLQERASTAQAPLAPQTRQTERRETPVLKRRRHGVGPSNRPV